MYFPGTFVNHLEGDAKNGHIDFYVIQNIRIFGFMENVKVQENPLIYAFRKAQGSIFDCSIYKIYVFRKNVFFPLCVNPLDSVNVLTGLQAMYIR